MSNTEWKNGYDAGFTAGWNAAKKNSESYTFTNFPPVYYATKPVGSYSSYGGTMADTPSYTHSISTGGLSGTLSETVTVRNLTDHTLIV